MTGFGGLAGTLNPDEIVLPVAGGGEKEGIGGGGGGAAVILGLADGSLIALGDLAGLLSLGGMGVLELNDTGKTGPEGDGGRGVCILLGTSRGAPVGECSILGGEFRSGDMPSIGAGSDLAFFGSAGAFPLSDAVFQDRTFGVTKVVKEKSVVPFFSLGEGGSSCGDLSSFADTSAAGLSA